MAKSAICERTSKSLPVAEGFFVADVGSAEWSFVSKDAPEKHGDYNVAVASIVKSPEALVDWIAHLNEKTWFDSKKFADFFTGFRKANNLFNSL